MLAILAFISFMLALILHLISKAPAKDVEDFVIAGLALTAAHLAWPFTPWRRP